MNIFQRNAIAKNIHTILWRYVLFLLLLLPAITVAADSSSMTFSGLGSFLSGKKENEILRAEQAFKLTMTAKDAQTLTANFNIVPGYYLYRQRIKFESKSAEVRIGTTEIPNGNIKQDANFGKTEVFHQNFSAILNLAFTGKTPESVKILATYQGCSEKGLCYAPIHQTLEVKLVSQTAAVSSINNVDAKTPKTSGEVPVASTDTQATSLLESGKLWLIVLSFFGFGLLLSLTPCVLPMIPILSGIIVGAQNSNGKSSGLKKVNRLHSFNLSLAYTLGMALSYTLAGILAGLSGYSLSAALQNPWALGIGAVVFVLLALSMFGFYELQLPSALESRIASTTNRFKGGKFASVFIMGALSALIVSPCIAAPLAGALAYISKTQDAFLGGIALFTLAMGMGVPCCSSVLRPEPCCPNLGHG